MSKKKYGVYEDSSGILWTVDALSDAAAFGRVVEANEVLEAVRGAREAH